MKNLLFAFMLLAALQSNGQKSKKDSLYLTPTTAIYTGLAFRFNDPSVMYCMVKEGSDTLEVFYGTKIKYIKIGTEVFKITSPSLEKVERLFQSGRTIYGTPNFSPTNNKQP